MLNIPIYQQVILMLIPLVFAITIHEAAHGWVASKLGDQTARLMGRLTLNPIKHIDLIGTIILPIVMKLFGNFLFGWAKPVPVDFRNLRNPRRDMAWVAIAGPGSNLIMAILWAFIYKLLSLTGNNSEGLILALMYMCIYGIQINAILLVLNLIPIPPLDGSRVMSALLPPRVAYKYNKLEPYGIIIIIVLLVLGPLSYVMMPFYTGFIALLSHIFSI